MSNSDTLEGSLFSFLVVALMAICILGVSCHHEDSITERLCIREHGEMFRGQCIFRGAR